MDREYYTISEVAEKLAVSEQTIRKLVNSNQLIGTRVGKSYRISKFDLKNFLNDHGSRDVISDLELIDSCQEELWIQGTNALTPLHLGLEKIIKALKRGVYVKILLSDPDCDEFREREIAEEKTEGTFSGRLRAELTASIAICMSIRNNNEVLQPERLELRLHSSPPIKSLVMIDPTGKNGRCNVNMYPPQSSVRGNQGKTESIYLRSKDMDNFLFHAQNFTSLWTRSRKIDLDKLDPLMIPSSISYHACHVKNRKNTEETASESSEKSKHQ